MDSKSGSESESELDAATWVSGFRGSFRHPHRSIKPSAGRATNFSLVAELQDLFKFNKANRIGASVASTTSNDDSSSRNDGARSFPLQNPPHEPKALDLCKKCVSIITKNQEFVRADEMKRLWLWLSRSYVKENARSCGLCRLLARCSLAWQFEKSGNLGPPSSKPPRATYQYRRHDFDRRYRLHANESAIGLYFDVHDGPEKTTDDLDYDPEYSSPFKDLHLMRRFQLFTIDDASRINVKGCNLVHDEIDFSVLKGWIRFCEAEHPGCQSSPQEDVAATQERPFWTFDLSYRCLRRTELSDRFVTLSYALGCARIEPFAETDEEFLDMVAQERQVSPDRIENLPLTIKDAMLAAAKLGENLIWIDAICIPPGVELRAQQIEMMDGIYSAACCTLFVATGDSLAEGIPGVRSGTRHVLQYVERISDKLALAAPLISPVDDIPEAQWNNRAWCYQEFALSRRKIFFTDAGVVWECLAMQCDEDAPTELKAETPSFLSRSGIKFGHANRVNLDNSPSFQFENEALEQLSKTSFVALDWQAELLPSKEYAQLVREYTGRKLTFPHDIELAFAGLARRVATYLGTKIIYCLPEGYLTQALLWQARGRQAVRRRYCANNYIPTWSWAGWHGDFEYDEESQKRSPSKSDSLTFFRTLLWWHRGNGYYMKSVSENRLAVSYSFEEAKPLSTRDEVFGIPEGQELLQDWSEIMQSRSYNHISPEPEDLRLQEYHLYTYACCVPLLNLVRHGNCSTRLRNVPASKQRPPWYGHSGAFHGTACLFSRDHHDIGSASLPGQSVYDVTELDVVLLGEQHKVRKLATPGKALEEIESYHCLVIEWQNGFEAERVGTAVITDPKEWWGVGPIWKNIVLR